MHPDYFILEGSWDGLDIKYIYSENSISDALMMYISSIEKGLTDGLNNLYHNQRLNCLEINFSASLFQEIFGQTISTSLHNTSLHELIQVEIVDPSMLHLAYLLQSEMETPKILSQEYVLAIVTAMITAIELQMNQHK